MSEHESGSQEHPTNLNPDFAFGRDVPDRKVQPDFEAVLNIKFDPSEDELRSWRDWVVEQDRQGGFRQVGQRGEYDSAVELVGPDPDIKVMQYVGDDSGVGLEIDQDAYEALKPYISANFLVPTAYIDTQDANPSRRYYALQNRQDGVSSVVRDFNAEFFFECHDQFDGVERVSAQIVDKACAFDNLVGIDAKMINNNFLYAFCDIAHVGFLDLMS